MLRMTTGAQPDSVTTGGRRWRRSHLTVPIRVTIENSKRLNVINTRGSQMNDGGLTVRADRELAIGDEAEIKFTPPHFYPFVRLRGVIRNRVGDLYGVEFLANSAPQSRQLGLFRHILLRWGA
ncbi:MAG TPA: PilZ domain-containing protein [Candidatus Bathyarchaeia archaeon]|nr:PilZ domain-containing protein [Candidatus Bathyarchaeia archaeon]